MSKSPSEIYQCDNGDVQFPVQDGDGNIFLVAIFISFDSFSRRVIGWEIGYSDFEAGAVKGFQMGCREYCFIPEEIVIDYISEYEKPLL
jgi:hypothetical protein